MKIQNRMEFQDTKIKYMKFKFHCMGLAVDNALY